ncbi:MAG: hypothetical protein GY732_19765 [Gammaproteobacteria bacterium]|nr:hypothetical protein [Gammaproteobacteria bacterium]
MNNMTILILRVLIIPVLCLGWSQVVLAKPEPGACVEMGALVWNDWTSTDAGGSGMPAGETIRDYVRCKSCHGWDRQGLKGGYVRRTRTAERPNAGLGDSNNTSRDIAPGMGDYYHIIANEVLHTDIGRSFEDGSGSWVELGNNPSPAEMAAHETGYTLGNKHPDFSTTGANASDVVLTQDQIDCVVDFVNFGDSDPKFYFVSIDTDKNPAEYHINTSARVDPGKTFYDESCLSCHGDPAVNFNGDNGGKPEGGMLAFLGRDGKYSEFVHKARWGIPDTIMTRAAIGSPDSQNMLDVMLYLQGLNAASSFTVGGNVSGLEGDGLVLQNNAGDDLAVSESGGFTFSAALADGSSYTVTVSTQPTDPVQTCSVSNGNGTLAGANVTDVVVTCSTDSFTVGGVVSGLEGSGLVLQNNADDDLAVAATGGFTFPTALADGSAYAVTVKTQPSNPAQTCSVSNGSGTLSGSDVSNVLVSCYEFWINAGLNDAWYYPLTDGQGFFITVFPEIGKITLSWFTYDTVRPDDDVTAHLGEPGHRWLNALGDYFGDQAVLDITIASGGLFDTPTEITEVIDGTIILTFTDCENGTVEYDIPSISRSGIVPIQRVVADNIALCEALKDEAVNQQGNITQKSDIDYAVTSGIPVPVIETPLMDEMNPGLNDAWYYPDTDGQGFFITVFPVIEKVVLSWFTYDTVRPGDDVTANLGEPGHRWFNALGEYFGNQAVLEIIIASGGLFDTPTEVTEINDGSILLTFTDCKNGTVEYDIPSIDRSGIVPIQRVVADNITLCEALLSE